MSVKEIKNRNTGEYGFQAVVRDQSRYYSVKLHGRKEARELAVQAEIDFCATLGFTVKEFKAQARTPKAPKARNPTVGLYLSWRMRKGSQTGIEFASLCGFARKPDGRPANFCISIHKHGLEAAIHLAFARRLGCGLPIPNYDATYKGMLELLQKEGQGKTYRSV